MKRFETVLLVEDNEDDVELMLHAFRKAEVPGPIQVVSDGDAAIAYLDGRAPYEDRSLHPLPTLILLDLKLPRRSGFEVLHFIRHHPPVKTVPVVVLTSSNQTGDIRRAYELCANSYLVKPVARDALIAMMRSLDQYWLGMNETVR